MLGVPCRMFLFALTTGKASHEINTQKAWRAGKSVRGDVQAGCCSLPPGVMTMLPSGSQRDDVSGSHLRLADAACGGAETPMYR